jgi:mono/diheme cytochrome c family protein
MVLRILFFSLSLISLSSCTGGCENVPAINLEEASEKISGKTLFEQNCAACHGTDGKLGASGAKDLTTSQMTDEEISGIIRLGKNGMPPMESLLGSEENLNAVRDYVKSLRK